MYLTVAAFRLLSRDRHTADRRQLLEAPKNQVKLMQVQNRSLHQILDFTVGLRIRYAAVTCHAIWKDVNRQLRETMTVLRPSSCMIPRRSGLCDSRGVIPTCDSSEVPPDTEYGKPADETRR